MTILQKSLLVTSILAVACTGWYEVRLVSRQNDQIQQIQQDTQRLAQANRQLLQQRDAEQKKLNQDAKLADSKALNPATTNALGNWVANVNTLKQWLAKMPDKAIPEFQFLTEENWLEVVKTADLSTEDGARQALEHLRTLAKSLFVPSLQAALKKYLADHDNQLPAAMADLKPYFDVPVSDALLQRYAVNYTGNASSIPSNKFAVQEKAEARVDDTYDTQLNISLGGYEVQSTAMVWKPGTPEANHLQGVLQDAMQNYLHDHANQPFTAITDLQPYITDPADYAALQKMLTAAAQNLQQQVHQDPGPIHP